ncbi:glycosyltransferase [uncultured Flavobacterium sp.]|uniref:glycosyltransferase family 2 protein n=1 Tax=uncultured Flavobacterium sp. TaxID=165435 RepID=UPI0029314B66|nr:glycosyltransferase [uncultured Flavobacterium sp.]
MKVSVCMITYGHEKYIREAIEGVLMQECDFEIELVLSNDCSPDQTDKIIHDILSNHPKASCIKYYKHEKNIGMMPNFIDALKKCNGKYVALCEGDDYWTDSLKLQKQVNFLEVNPDYVLCFHQVDILKTNGEIVDDFITKVPENYETIETLARLGNYIHTPSVVFRNIINQFPFEFEQSPIGDYFLYMMLAENGKLKYFEDKMVVYRYGVGVYSVESITNKLVMIGKQYSCLLSYLKEESLKKIILDRNVLLLNSFDASFCSKYNSNDFIINHKSLKTIIKILLKKIKQRLL